MFSLLLSPLLSTGSTDFGNVTFVVPGIHPYFYIGSNALNHTEEYTAAAGMYPQCYLQIIFAWCFVSVWYVCVFDFGAGDDRAQFFTLRTAKALAMTALDVLLHPELLQKVKQEFTEAKLKEDKTLTKVGWEQSAKYCWFLLLTDCNSEKLFCYQTHNSEYCAVNEVICYEAIVLYFLLCLTKMYSDVQYCCGLKGTDACTVCLLHESKLLLRNYLPVSFSLCLFVREP